MNTPQHRSDPSHTPLDPEERRIAEALSSLPASEPDTELDARILGLARAAVARPSSKPRSTSRRRPGLWWMGSAAGAVLAAGLGWQLAQQQGLEFQPGAIEETASSKPARARMRDESADQSISVEMIQRPASAPPAIEKSRANETPAERQTEASDRLRRRSAVPESSPAPAQSAPQPVLAPAPLAEPEQVPDAAGAGLAAAAEEPSAQADESGSRLERIEVTGSRIRSVESLDSDGFPPVIHDARLKPEQWLLRVRARRDAGQLDLARKSLQEFVRSYPYLVVPDDLRGLLNERP